MFGSNNIFLPVEDLIVDGQVFEGVRNFGYLGVLIN